MTGPDRALRLAAGTRLASERRLELIPALSAATRIARHHGISPQARVAVESHELSLPGIGGRYLQGVATHVPAHGWPADEVGALLAALEDRSAMWVVCSSAGALVRAGLAPEGARLRRAGAARFAGGRWSVVRIPAAELDDLAVWLGLAKSSSKPGRASRCAACREPRTGRRRTRRHPCCA